MNIGGVSSSGYTTSTSSSNASTVKSLEKQIASIQKEMAKVQADKTLDEQTKSQQVSVYQTQIQELQAQVAKAQQGSNSGQVQQDSRAQNAQGPDGAEKPNGPPPPPPDKMDFENISDDDLKSYLEKMQELTGTIPGVEEGTSVSDLTDEQLQDVRSTLIDMSNNMQEAGQKMGPPPDFVDSLSDDDLKSLLNIIKESKGNIPGIGDSDEVDIEELTDEQLNAARTALSDMQQQRFQESMRGRMEEMMQSSGGSVYAALSNNSI